MNTSNDFSYYVPRVHYTTSPKLLSTNISTGYYQHPNQDSSFLSPYSYGKKNDFYISPTFTSGDCFYPTRLELNNNSNNNITNNSKVSPIRERSISPKPNNNQQQVSRQSIQSDLKSYIQSETKSQNQSLNLYQQYKTGQSKSPIKNMNSQSKLNTTSFSPFQLKLFQEQKHLQNNIIPTQPPSPKIASRTPSKKSEINTPARSQRENYLNSNSNMNLKRQSNNNTNNSHKNESHSTITKKSDITQEICTKCFNHEIIDHKNRDLQYQKEQQKILLQNNLENEQAIIQREALELLRKRENERQLIRDGFKAHIDKQNQIQKQREQLREQQRNMAQETTQLAQEQQMHQKQDGMQKRIQFLKEIEEQIKQKEILRAQGQGNYLLTGLDIGIENKNMAQQAEQKRQELIEIKQQNKRVIDEKIKAQEQQKIRDKEYQEWAKQQDYMDKMKEVIEKQELEHKNKTLKDGLNSQLLIKNERIKQQKQQDLDAEKYLKLYVDQSEPAKQINLENCGGCHQQYPKEHLSKFKKPKRKI